MARRLDGAEGSRAAARGSSAEGGSDPLATAVLAADTSPTAERLQVELWRKMSPLEKARAVSAITRTTQELCLAGIRERHPRAPEHECLLRLAVLKLGRELAGRVYPETAGLPGL